MIKGSATRLVGSSLGLAGFAIAVIAGLGADNDANTILLRAIIAMVGCSAAGQALGWAGERAISAHAEKELEAAFIRELGLPERSGSAAQPSQPAQRDRR